MRPTRAVLLTVAATATALLMLTGCTGDTAATGAPTATRTAAAPIGPTAAADGSLASDPSRLSTALLTVADLPDGWVVDQDQVNAGDDGIAGATYTPEACTTVLGSTGQSSDAAPPTAEAHAGFSNKDARMTLAQDLTVPGPVDVPDLLTAVAGCPSFTETDPDGTVSTGLVTKLDLPTYGDSSMAMQLSGGSFTLDVVVVNVGDTQLSIAMGGLEPPDPAVLEQVVTTAVARVPAA